ncbi:MAG TPA: hypothetical protein GXX50_06410 [Firmicutes bacterium]|nr:hypothetical protein [Bacillota bacterium]
MNRRLGLALGGGGLRGVAHVGVLSELSAAGLAPDVIAGTSSGSIVAALYALGYPPAELARQVTRLRASALHDLFRPLPLWPMIAGSSGSLLGRFRLARLLLKLPHGFIDARSFERFLRFICRGGTFQDLKLPLVVLATDIASGELVAFTQVPPRQHDLEATVFLPGRDLATALRASSSLPGYFPPKEVEGRLLVDGALRANVPVPVLRAMGAEVVVAVDLGTPPGARVPRTLVDILWQTMSILERQVTQAHLAQADVVIAPQVPPMPWTDAGRIPLALAAGAQAARAALPRLHAVLTAPAGREKTRVALSAALAPEKDGGVEPGAGQFTAAGKEFPYPEPKL